MIAQVKKRVQEVLAGLATPVVAENVFTDKKALKTRGPLPRVVLVTASEKTEPMGDIVAVETDEDLRVRRYVTRRAKRLLDVTMVVQAPTEAEADTILVGVVDKLLDGFLAEGRQVAVYRSDTSWVDDESLSRPDAEALVGLRFEGGIYKTRTVPLLTGITVEGEVI